MNQRLFTEQLNRLIGTFSETAFKPERIRAISNIVESIPEPWLKEIVDTFIDNFKYAPLPKDFREAVYALRKSNKVYEDIETVYTTGCVDCYDMGFLFCKFSASEPTTLAICHCPAGEAEQGVFTQKDLIIPKWEVGKFDQVFGFIKLPFPVKWFKPEVPDEFDAESFLMGAMDEKVSKWSQFRTTANQYWIKKAGSAKTDPL